MLVLLQTKCQQVGISPGQLHLPAGSCLQLGSEQAGPLLCDAPEAGVQGMPGQGACEGQAGWQLRSAGCSKVQHVKAVAVCGLCYSMIVCAAAVSDEAIIKGWLDGVDVELRAAFTDGLLV